MFDLDTWMLSVTLMHVAAVLIPLAVARRLLQNLLLPDNKEAPVSYWQVLVLAPAMLGFGWVFSEDPKTAELCANTFRLAASIGCVGGLLYGLLHLLRSTPQFQHYLMVRQCTLVLMRDNTIQEREAVSQMLALVHAFHGLRQATRRETKATRSALQRLPQTHDSARMQNALADRAKTLQSRQNQLDTVAERLYARLADLRVVVGEAEATQVTAARRALLQTIINIVHEICTAITEELAQDVSTVQLCRDEAVTPLRAV